MSGSCESLEGQVLRLESTVERRDKRIAELETELKAYKLENTMLAEGGKAFVAENKRLRKAIAEAVSETQKGRKGKMARVVAVLTQALKMAEMAMVGIPLPEFGGQDGQGS